MNGLLAYAYVALGTRTFGADAFAPISVLWTIWAMSSAVVTFPVQHWVIRTVEADSAEGRVRAAQARILGAAVLLSSVVGAVTWLTRATLFGDPGLLFPALAALIPLGSAVVGFSRGALAARRRFVAAGAAIAGENLIRVVVGAGVIMAGLGSGPFAAAIASGFLVALFWPSALRFADGAPVGPQTSPMGFLAGVAGGTLIAQLVLTGGPLILAALGGAPAAVTGLFSALALFRAPYLLATGLAARVTGSLVRLLKDATSSTIRHLTQRTIVIVAAAVPLGALVGAAVGSSLLHLVFGPEVTLPPGLIGVVAAGSTLALGSLFYTLVLVAGGRARAVTLPWVIAAFVSVGWAIFGIGEPLTSVTWAFFLAEVVAFVVMVILGSRALAVGHGHRERTLGADDAARPTIG